MGSGWNLIGLCAWIIIAIYFVYMIISIKKRNRQALLHQDEKRIKRNLLISVFQGILLLVSILAMAINSLMTDKSTDNVSVIRNYKPIVLDTNGHKSYYVNAYNTDRQSYDQYYTYLTKGERYRVPASESIIISGSPSVSFPMVTYHSDGNRIKLLDQRYQKAWIETITAKYKASFLNGLGMRTGRKASYYVVIRVPDQSFIYYH